MGMQPPLPVGTSIVVRTSTSGQQLAPNQHIADAMKLYKSVRTNKITQEVMTPEVVRANVGRFSTLKSHMWGFEVTLAEAENFKSSIISLDLSQQFNRPMSIKRRTILTVVSDNYRVQDDDDRRTSTG